MLGGFSFKTPMLLHHRTRTAITLPEELALFSIVSQRPAESRSMTKLVNLYRIDHLVSILVARSIACSAASPPFEVVSCGLG